MDPNAAAEGEERSRFPAAFLAGVGVVLVLLVVLWLVTRSMESSGPRRQKLPFGPVEQAYAAQIHFQSGEMSHSTNFLNQEFIYIEGSVSNSGPRTVRILEASFEFRDALNQVVLRNTERVIEPPDILAAGVQRDFRVTFEHVPLSWSQQYPSITVTGLALE